MRSSVTDFATALAVPAIAALGGALVVFSEYDDAPGGMLLGFLLVLGAAVLSVMAARPGT